MVNRLAIPVCLCSTLALGCSTTSPHATEIDHRFEHGMTLLMAAAMYGELEAAEKLIARGADVNARNDDGYTPLALAVIAKHPAVVKALIDHGADVNLASPLGSPLMLATLGRDQKIIGLLKEAGAKPGFAGHSGPPKHPGKLPPELLRP